MRGQGREPSQRQLRVGEELRHVLAWTLERGEIRDPGLGGVAVTVTEVRVSPDLRHASVFVTPLGGGDMDPVLAALGRARPYLRRLIAARVRLKFVPEIAFHADRSFEQAGRIARLLAEDPGGRRPDATPARPEDDDAA